MSRDQLLADALRLEDKELEARKDLWVLWSQHPSGDRVLVVEAVTGPGAVAVAGALDLLDPENPGDLLLHGPNHRDAWPEEYWYRWLTEADLVRMEAELASGQREVEAGDAS